MRSFASSNAHVSAVHDVIRGAGCRVWDLHGDEYVEFGSGLRSVTLGHGFEPVMDALRSRG